MLIRNPALFPNLSLICCMSAAWDLNPSAQLSTSSAGRAHIGSRKLFELWRRSAWRPRHPAGLQQVVDGPNSRVTFMTSASKFRACVCVKSYRNYVSFFNVSSLSLSWCQGRFSSGREQSRAAYNQWEPITSPGNQHTHTFWTLFFLHSHRNTTWKDYHFRVSSVLQDSRQTALCPQRKGPKSPHSAAPTQLLPELLFPPGKPVPKLQAMASRAPQHSNPCTDLTAPHNTIRAQILSANISTSQFSFTKFCTTNMAPCIFSSLAKGFEIRDVTSDRSAKAPEQTRAVLNGLQYDHTLIN